MTAEQIINKYLRFSGDRSYKNFSDFYEETIRTKLVTDKRSRDFQVLCYIEQKIIKGMSLCAQYGEIYVVVDEESREEIEDILKEAGWLSGSSKRGAAKKKKKAPKGDLGKIVDQGKVAARGKSDIYWRRNGMELVFKADDPKVRSGAKIPASYEYTNVKFLEKYYQLSGIEFGNWLSQQDRFNYLTGLGLALFDMHKAIGFKPEQVSINGKISVAFGARGRGKALAHFEPGSFAINLTRYSRPQEVKTRPDNYKRVDLILKDGGVGSFAHEYGHALDYFGGMHVEKGDTLSLSGDDNTDPRPDMALMKKNTLRGLMEKLLYKINWKSQSTPSNYYKRLSEAVKTDYYFQRNEIFARAFEVYVHYKLDKAKYYNIFLHKTKYRKGVYLNYNEMKALERDFDALIKGIQKHL